MAYSNADKEQICCLLEEKRNLKKNISDASFARSIGLQPVDYSNLTTRKWVDNQTLLSERKWNKISLMVDFNDDNEISWKTAETTVRDHVFTILKAAKKTSLTSMIIDEPGVGKSHAVSEFAEKTENAFLIKGSNAKTPKALLNAINKALGLQASSNIERESITDYINQLKKPILIVDEAGFLKPASWKLLHEIYEDCEFHLAIVVLGSHGLLTELKKGQNRKENGYAEMNSRLGINITTDDVGRIFLTELERKVALKKDFEKVIIAQGITDKQIINEIISKSSDLRKVRREIIKIQRL